MNLTLIRDDKPGQAHNWGELYCDGLLLGQTLEDPDRRLENGGEKIDGDTAIPRCDAYRVTLTESTRFGRLMPLVNGVVGFSGVRFHGGNTESDTHGCILLGHNRTPDGISDCKGVNERLINLLLVAEHTKEPVWLEVK